MSGEELECATTTQASKWLFAQAATKLRYEKVTRTGFVDPLIVAADDKQSTENTFFSILFVDVFLRRIVGLFRFFLEIANLIEASCVIKIMQNKWKSVLK